MEETEVRMVAVSHTMKILFLHGWHSIPGGVKPTFLNNAGHEVINPPLDDDDFDLAVRTAQAEYDQHTPDVVVGSSRGGAVALNINGGDTPLVLLCPAWKTWGNGTACKPNTVILHSRKDDVIPFADSEELVANSGLPPETLIEVGDDHRLADPEPLKAMLEACQRVLSGVLIREMWTEVNQHGDFSSAAANMDLDDRFKAFGIIDETLNQIQEGGEQRLRKAFDILIGWHDDWRICCHEAGHAVVAIKLQIPLEQITRGEGTNGEVEPIHDPSDNCDQKTRARYQLFYAAGAAAERIVFGTERRTFDELVDPLEGDRKQHERLESQERQNAFGIDVEEAIACFGGEDGKKFIERVAALLKERRDKDGRKGQITQEEVAEIIGDKLW